MARELWIATGNPKKRHELDRLLRPLGYELRLQSEAPVAVDVEEDRPDFAGNAEKKAAALAAVVHAPVIADDSGLCVDALDGRPGVHSARYAGPGKTDADRMEKLLGELEGVPPAERSARFVSSICLVDAAGAVLGRFEGSVAGFLRNTPKGDGGFGYDPLFVATPYLDSDTTFAELTNEQKDAVSHRGDALRKLSAWLRENPIP